MSDDTIHDEYDGSVLQGESLDGSLDGAPFLLPSGYPFAQSLDCVLQAKADAGAMSAPFTIVTRGKELNRHGNKVQIAPGPQGQGILLDNYAKNPVVLFDHGGRFPLPIGKSEDQKGNLTVKLSASKASAVAYFSQTLAEAAQVFGLIDEGILRTASIAFIPRKAMRMKLKPNQGGVSKYDAGEGDVIDLTTPYLAFDFLESEMFEWSVVSVPADPDAVRKCLDRGRIGQAKITRSLLPTIQRMAGNKPVWAPGFTLPQQSLILSVGGVKVEMNGVIAQSAQDWGSIIDSASETFLRLAEKPKAQSVDAPADEGIILPPNNDEAAAVSTDAAEPTDGLAGESQSFDIGAITQAIHQGIDAGVKPAVQRQESLEEGLRRLFGKL